MDTIVVFVVDDSGDSDILEYTLELEYPATHSQAIAGAATYNTTTGDVTAYIGRAPSQAFSPGWEKALLNQQIMKSDLSDTDARTEVRTRVGNYFATVNPRAILTVRFMPGYYWVVPTLHQLYAFEIAASDNTRGRVFTSADKWLCISIDYSHNPDTMDYELNAQFELIVAGGNAGIQVTLVPDVNDLQPPSLPPLGAGIGAIDPLINYPIDNPDFTLPGGAGDLGLVRPGAPVNQPPVGCEVLNVSMRTGTAIVTSEISQSGETYTVHVEGDAQIETSTNWVENFDFTIDDGGWSSLNSLTGGTQQASYVAGQYWQHSGGAGNGFGIAIAIPAGTVLTRIVTVQNISANDGADGWAYSDYFSGGAIAGTVLRVNSRDANGSASYDDAINYTMVETVFGFAITHLATQITQVSRIQLEGLGVNPFGGSVGGQRGDAFYKGYDEGVGQATLYGAGQGLKINSATPGNIPVYSSAHVYDLTHAGNNNTIEFEFDDTDFSDNDNRNLVVTVCGAGMKQP